MWIAHNSADADRFYVVEYPSQGSRTFSTQQNFNHTIRNSPADGSTVFLASHVLDVASSVPIPTLRSSIPTFALQLTSMVALTSSQVQSWQLACLVYKLKAVIETREDRTEGMLLSVQPLSTENSSNFTGQGTLFSLGTVIMLPIELNMICQKLDLRT